MLSQNFNAISLFTGAGGMDIGFESAGVTTVFANEIIKDAAETYNLNRNSKIMVIEDINNILTSLDKFRNVDIIFGGPPCQGFSIAGKMDPNDQRSKLIFTFLDAVEIVKPKMFVMENVKALGVLDKWAPIRKKYLERAIQLGYKCVPFLLTATDYGVSQKRERVFFIGIRDDDNLFFESTLRKLIEQHKNKAPIIKDLLRTLGKAGSEMNPITCTSKITFATNPVMRKSPYAGMYFNGQGRPIDIDGYANTLPASMGGNKTPFVDEEYLYGNADFDWIVSYHKGLLEKTIIPVFQEAPKRLRRITIKEAARIQTFPDDYIFCGNKGSIYTQIGNAVPCKMAEAVARAVVKYLRIQDK